MARIDRLTMIISVALAIFLWAYVHATLVTPDKSRVIHDVPVQESGQMPSGYGYKFYGGDSKVDIEVIGQAEQVDALDRESVTLRLELDSIPVNSKSQPVSVKLKETLPEHIRLAKTAKISVNTYPLVQKSIDVRIGFTVQPPPGASIGAYVAEPDRVTVEGSADDVKLVRYASVMLDPEQSLMAHPNFVPRAIDADGNVSDDVRVLNSTVMVRMATFTGQQTTRQIAVGRPKLLHPPPGYTVHVLGIAPAFVTLSGGPALLDSLPAFIDTEPIDVRNTKKTTFVTTHLIIPAHLTVVDDTTTVSVELAAMR